MITLDDLRARHAEVVAAREQLQREFHAADTGHAYVLGELESMIAVATQRAADAAAATRFNREPDPAEATMDQEAVTP